jgi:hypothetical protein
VSEMNINSILIALKNGGPGNAFTGNHRGDARWRARPGDRSGRNPRHCTHNLLDERIKTGRWRAVVGAEDCALACEVPRDPNRSNRPRLFDQQPRPR